MYRMRLHTLGALSVIVFVWAFHPLFVSIGSNVLGSLSANVGVGAGVAPTEFSTLVQQIDEKEQELEAREAAVLEAETRRANERALSTFSIEWYVTLMAFILLVLVLINFYLDFRHREESKI